MQSKVPQIFNRKLLRKLREKYYKQIIATDFLTNYAISLLIEKLSQTKLSFKRILILGNINQELQLFLKDNYFNAQIICANLSFNYLSEIDHQYKIVLDEEILPFADSNFDLVISVLNLHNINDLPGSLVQIRNILKDRGMFVAVMLGEDTFGKLRQSCIEADSQYNCVTPKVAPFIDVKTMGNLLTRTGFLMPVTDSQNLIVQYDKVRLLLQDIKYMGEGNILCKKAKNLLSKGHLNLIEKIYLNKFTKEGIIDANFELINLTALKN